VRGIDIAPLLLDRVDRAHARIVLGATVVGLYRDKTLAMVHDQRFSTLKAQKVIVASGASENMLAFENCDLPGVYGAGAVQTLMNVYGVLPGRRVLMVGAGNIGLIVSYQLLQAGVEVVEVIESADQIGGYHVHAAKIRRAGVPISPRHTVVRALGADRIAGAVVARVDENWNPLPQTERELKVDVICLAVGLSPTAELLFQAGCRCCHIAELGGHVAVHDENLQTSADGIYVAGDASGIEEASTAMLEGSLAGLGVAESLTRKIDRSRKDEARRQLAELRAGPFGQKARRGKELLMQEACRYGL
jgi:sarcosine oxidase subunit alpha